MLTVVDQFSRLSPLTEPRFWVRRPRRSSRPGGSIVGQAGTARCPITVDHGTEFTTRALEEWAYRRGVKLDFTHLGKTYGERAHRVVQRAGCAMSV